jgi:hypothetical protein
VSDGPFFDRLVRRTLVGGVHPVAVLGAVEDALREASRGGREPNHLTLSFHPDDLAALRPAIAELERQVRAVATRSGSAARLLVVFEPSAGVAPGEVAVTARFADMEHRPVAVPRGATQRITRHRGVTLLLGDGTKVRLTHTPFSIGRGPGNDLVLVSFAVSREHARIISGPEGFVIEDLGSRNRLVVDGATVDRAVLEPGLAVRIGDIELWLEREG